jgi:predicted acetyltransferase
VTNFDIRPVADHERRAAVDTLRNALLSGPVNDADFEKSQASWDDSDALAAWDDERCIGNVAAYRFDSTVPGGARLPIAGVTRVGVLPTHTRKGVLTQLMHRLLVESRERGNPIATLHASETPIYRRFGFGLATDAVAVEVTTRNATPWTVPALPGSMRLLAYTEVVDVVPALYDRVARWRVGSISRPDWMMARWILKEATEPTEIRQGKGSFVAVHADADGVDDGYVFYDVDWDERFAANPTGAGKVRDLWGSSPAVELELWRYLLGIDLITTWRADMRPTDEPVRRAMHDLRAYETRQVIDDQWVRLLDVDAALGARTFGQVDTTVTIGVHDPVFSENCASWHITPDGAETTNAPADLTVDIAALSAAYLGAVSWHDLAASGAASASAQLLTRLDALFAVRPTPFCGTGY